MIAQLSGLIDQVSDGSVIVNVGGVGYLVFCSSRSLNILVGQGTTAVNVHIEMHVREDHIHLYGFADKLEQEWFKLLTTVQGVGAKVALAMLSVSDPETLAQAVAATDKASISRAPGVGPKLATRIISELKDKIGALDLHISNSVYQSIEDVDLARDSDSNGAPADAVSALVNLGYGRTESYTAVAKAVKRLGDGAVIEALIKEGLAGLSTFEPRNSD